MLRLKLGIGLGFVALAVGCGGSSRQDDDTGGFSTTLTPTTAGGSGDTSGGGEGTDGQVLDVGAGGTDTAGDGGGTPQTCEGAAMAQSNQGCEFWAVDLPNAWAGINGSPAPEDQQFAVVVANTATDDPATVEVFLGQMPTAIDTATVMPGAIHEFRLPAQSVPPRQMSASVTAFRVESDIPITAYQFNPLDNTVQVFSNDASLLFPTHVLGTDYTAITGDSILLATDIEPLGDNSGAFVTVVAVEDATTVDLFPTWGLYPGQFSGIPLNKGQAYTAISVGTSPGTPGDGNLSGTRVTADKPIAVFSGNVATIEPQPGQCCADHMEHQMLPLVAWGDAYAAVPAPAPGAPAANNRVAYRITGSFDGTVLQYDPIAPIGAPATIDAGKTVRFETDVAFTVSTPDANKPFAITEFLLSNQILNGFGQPGDPAMIALPAVEQFRDTYIFLVPQGYLQNYVTVALPAGSDVRLDGVSVAVANLKPLGQIDGQLYQYVHLDVPVGSHTIEADEPVGIVSIGYSTDVSYGYPGGSGLAEISVPPPPAG